MVAAMGLFAQAGIITKKEYVCLLESKSPMLLMPWQIV
jgi:hypothetical protein